MPEMPTPRAPEALSLERLKQVVDALHEGVAILNAEGVVDFINPSGEQIFHFPAGELVGWKALDFEWEIVDRDGRPLPREAHPALRVLETGEPQPTTVLGFRAPSVEGMGTVWVEVTSRPLQNEGEARPHGSVSTFRDVTARMEGEAALRASEARYHMLTQSVPTGIFHMDADGACVWVNDAWSTITGRTHEEALGAGWVDAIHPEDLSRVSAEWERRAKAEEDYALEHRVLSADGVVRWVFCRSTRLYAEDGAFLGHIGSMADITEAKTAALLKDQLLGLASHELRAPLVAIQGGLTFLEPYIRDADQDGRKLFDIARRNANLLERLVRDLLDIDRLEGGQQPLDVERIPLRPLLVEAREGHLAAAGDRGVVLDPPEGGDVEVSVDRDRILQILNNLLSNAVKFSEPGGRVRLDVTTREGGVVVGVHDQGRGIPGELHERVFERFVQADPADSAERGGAGLGLAIARAIAHRHGGRIWVESEPGKGASFRLFLPEPPRGAQT